MKTIKNSIYTGLIALTLVFAGCSSDDDGGDGGDAALGTITAKVDGTTVTTLEMVTFATLTTVSGASHLQIQGNTGGTTSKAFILQIGGVDGTGTYQIDGSSNISILGIYSEITVDPANPTNVETNEWYAPHDASVAGEINISELSDTKVVGTFHFTGKNVDGDNSTKEITEGSFNIEF